MNSQTPEALRKAAILISSLDAHSADELLEKMGPEKSAQVRNMIMQLGDVSVQEQNRVMEEFLRGGGRLNRRDEGIELDDSLANRFTSAPAAIAKGDSFGPDGEAPPFQFLHQASGEAFAKYLLHEHPQTIAVVVSHLSPQEAADVVTRLSPELQAEVLQRVCELDETDPEIVREIEHQMETVLADEIRMNRRRQAGLAAVNAILSAVDSHERRGVLENLAQRDEGLATQLERPAPRQSVYTAAYARIPSSATPVRQKPQQTNRRDYDPGTDTNAATQSPKRVVAPVVDRSDFRSKAAETQQAKSDEESKPAPLASPKQNNESPAPRCEITFDELSRLDNSGLAAVFQAADAKLTLLALTGARQDLTDRILKQLPPQQAKILRSKMEQTGPLRLRDVEHAQQQLARMAGRLVDRGVITIPTKKRFAAAA